MAFLDDQLLSKLLIIIADFIEAMLGLVDGFFHQFSLLSIVR